MILIEALDWPRSETLEGLEPNVQALFVADG